jgi:hypothetical protein
MRPRGMSKAKSGLGGEGGINAKRHQAGARGGVVRVLLVTLAVSTDREAWVDGSASAFFGERQFF